MGAGEGTSESVVQHDGGESLKGSIHIHSLSTHHAKVIVIGMEDRWVGGRRSSHVRDSACENQCNHTWAML